MEFLSIHRLGLKLVLVLLMLMNLVSLLGLTNLVEETQAEPYLNPIVHELTFR